MSKGDTPTTVVRRPCPICGAQRAERWRELCFWTFDDCPLPAAFALVFCPSCALTYYDTAATQADLEGYYRSNGYYCTAATPGSGGGGAAEEQRSARIVELVTSCGARSDGLVVDVGCGKGTLLRALARSGFTRACGVDLLPECVERVRQGGIAAELGSALTLPFASQRADVLIYSHVAEHVLDLRGLVAEARRRLAPGGLVFVEVPDAARYAACARLPYEELYLEHVNHFGEEALCRIFAREGFAAIADVRTELVVGEGVAVPCLRAVFREGGAERTAERANDARVGVERYLAWCDAHPLGERLRALAASGAPVYLWGISQHAMLLLGQTALGRCRLKGLIDSDPFKQTKTLGGLPIRSPDALRDACPEDVVVVAADRFRDEICAEAARRGFPGRVFTLTEERGDRA